MTDKDDIIAAALDADDKEWLASLEEEWQAELWGCDEQAEARRTQRGRAFAQACKFIRLVRV